jgi:hypothetical protein
MRAAVTRQLLELGVLSLVLAQDRFILCIIIRRPPNNDRCTAAGRRSHRMTHNPNNHQQSRAGVAFRREPRGIPNCPHYTPTTHFQIDMHVRYGIAIFPAPVRLRPYLFLFPM